MCTLGWRPNSIIIVLIFLYQINKTPCLTGAGTGVGAGGHSLRENLIKSRTWDFASRQSGQKLPQHFLQDPGFVSDVKEEGGGGEEEEGNGEGTILYKIGGLFDKEDSIQEIAFKLAIERYNKNNEGSSSKGFMAHINYVPENSYLASAKVCEILQENVAAVLGPQNLETASHIQSICDAFEIPHIETAWDHQIRDSEVILPSPKLGIGQADFGIEIKLMVFLLKTSQKIMKESRLVRVKAGPVILSDQVCHIKGVELELGLKG